MLKKRGFQIILALALVSIISSVLWFSSGKPVNAMTITIGNPYNPTLGASTYLTVSIAVDSNDVLPVNSVQLDIYNTTYGISYPYYHDTYTLSPDPNFVNTYHTVNSSLGTHPIYVTATPSNWGQGPAGVSRFGYGTPEGGTLGTYPLGNTTAGWGYAVSPYVGNASLTYTITWTVPADWLAGYTYNTKVTVLTGSTTGSATTLVQTGLSAFSIGTGTTAYTPTLTSVSPTTGSTGSTVTIYGTNLSYVTQVYFGGTQVTSFTPYATYITAVLGNGSTGYISLYYNNGTGVIQTYQSGVYFTFSTAAPTITSFTPTTATTGNTVTITGTGFSGTTSVTFGGVAATFVVNSDTQITATIGAGASGAVLVTNPTGSNSKAGFSFSGTTSTVSLTGKIDAAGTFTQAVSAATSDNKATVSIATGNKGTLNGVALTQITVTPSAATQSAPSGTAAVALEYNFGPTGATFTSPVTVTLTYDPALIPSGIAETSLYIAWYDTATSKWVSLPSTVNTTTKTITATINHFTAFSAFASTSPSQIGVSELAITPASVQAGKEVTISVLAVNAGGASGTYNAILKINGNTITTKSVTLAGNSQQKVTFTTTQNTPGTYDVIVDYLSGSFTVTPAAPTTTTASPTTTTTAPATVTKTSSPSPSVTPDGSSTNWALIGGAIAVCLIVIWIIWRVIIRQRKSTM